MIRLLASAKGEGKTKRLIEMANQSVKVTKGHIIYMDDFRGPIYNLHRNIRLIETKDYPIPSCKELYGFLCGIISQDRDIETIYIDSLFNIEKLKNEELGLFFEKFNKLCDLFKVDFVIGIGKKKSDISDDLKKYLVS